MDVRILGPLELRDGDRRIDVTGTRQRALLAVLALSDGEVVSSDRLLEAVWGEEAPAAGTAALRVRMSQLRRALGEHGRIIVTRPPGYLLAVDPQDVDLHRFERLLRDGRRALDGGRPAVAADALERALELWRGPALADLAYEPFAQAAIARLEELRMTAREWRFDAELALGHHDRLIGELEALVAEHPLRERLWARLMLALYRSGRQGEALDAFRRARRALVGALGLEPGNELQQLHTRMLEHDRTLDPVASEPLVAATLPRRAVLAVTSSTTAGSPLGALAALLARGAGMEALVAAVVADAAALPAVTAGLNDLRGPALSRGEQLRVAAFTSADLAAEATRLASAHEAALVLVDAEEPAPALGAVMQAVAADVAAVAGAGRDGAATAGPVLVPFAGHHDEWAALDVGAWLAHALDVPLRLAGARPAPRLGRRDASRLLASASLAVQRAAGVACEPVLVGPGASGVLEAADGAAYVAVGLSPRWAREGLGAVRATIARDARCPVLLVRRGTAPGGLAPAEALTRFTWSRAH